jgi:hypothetical protein
MQGTRSHHLDLAAEFGLDMAFHGTPSMAHDGRLVSTDCTMYIHGCNAQASPPVAVPSSHVALLDPALGKHDQGAAHGLGRHRLGPVCFGTPRDWHMAAVGLAVGMAALRVQGSSEVCQRPTRLLLRPQPWWCVCNLHVFHLQLTPRLVAIGALPTCLHIFNLGDKENRPPHSHLQTARPHCNAYAYAIIYVPYLSSVKPMPQHTLPLTALPKSYNRLLALPRLALLRHAHAHA